MVFFIKRFFPFFLIIVAGINASGQSKKFTVIAYYMGGPDAVDSFAAEQLTHIIFSFCHLKGNALSVDNKSDSVTIQKLVALKKRNPKLKVLLSLGGWGGCATCSDVFTEDQNRKAFARSVKNLNDYFKTDGIDLDWEFPALPSLPGHSYRPEDKQNFTLLVQDLRNELGASNELSFAAGGFKLTINQSIEWEPVMKLADRVNLMTYDFVVRNTTGHNTALYSTPEQKISADNSIQYLMQLGVPANKIVIGASFYAKLWDSIPPVNNGLYQQGRARGAVHFRHFDERLPETEGYVRYWDSIAHAPYIYNASLQQFASFDDERSVKEKTEYALKNGLNGIMFWQLGQDKRRNGLLNVIFQSKGDH